MLFNPLQHREKVNEKNSSNAAQRLVMMGQQQQSSPSAEKDYVLRQSNTRKCRTEWQRQQEGPQSHNYTDHVELFSPKVHICNILA